MNDNNSDSPTLTSALTSAPRRKLGRGLGALMGEARREEPLVSPSGEDDRYSVNNGVARADGLAMLAVADIEPHPDQPRRHFDEEALTELAASIASRGVIQPVIVRPASARQVPAGGGGTPLACFAEGASA